MKHIENFNFNDLNPLLQVAMIMMGIGIAIPVVLIILSMIGVLMVLAFTFFAVLMVYATYVDYVDAKRKAT